MEKKIIPGESDRRWTLESRTNRSANGTPSANASWNFVDRRTRMERRVVYDRRQLIRFADDRRASRERRVGIDPWAFP